MVTLGEESQKAIYRLKTDKGELIEKFARWQAEYTGCEYEEIYNDTLSMLTMARGIYCEFLEASTEPTKTQEFLMLSRATDKIVQNKNLNNMKVDYYEVSLLGLLQRLYALQVRKVRSDGSYQYINGFTNYLDELEKAFKEEMLAK